MGHLFSTYAKFSENKHFLPPDTHAYVRFQFSGNFAYVLNEWLLKKFSETYSFLEILERFYSRSYTRKLVLVDTSLFSESGIYVLYLSLFLSL